MKKECFWRDSKQKPTAYQYNVYTSELLIHLLPDIDLKKVNDQKKLSILNNVDPKLKNWFLIFFYVYHEELTAKFSF